MNNLYNIYIENDLEQLTIFEVTESDLKRIIEAFEIGKEDIFIKGRKYLLKGLKEIRVFDMSKLQGSLKDFINSTEARQFSHTTGGRAAYKLPAYYMIGNDLTEDLITNDYGWKKQTEGSTILNQVSVVPVAHLQRVLNILVELNDKVGFKSTDFSPPEPSELDTPQVGWRLRLKNFPKYYFYFRELGDIIVIKHFPNKDENKERDVKISVRKDSSSFRMVTSQATTWLSIIADGIREQKRWNNFFNLSETNEYAPFEIIDDESDNTTELTPNEIEDIRIFLNAFEDLIQSSKTLTKETKTAYSEAKGEAEKKLDNKPTKSFYKWFGKMLDALTVKYLTDHKYREEVNGYLSIAIEKAKHLAQLVLDWGVRQIGGGHPH